MSVDLASILSVRKQVGIVQETINGIPMDNMPSQLFNLINGDYPGNTATYGRVKGERKVAKNAKYGARGHTANSYQYGEEQVTLLSPKEELAFDANHVRLLLGGVEENVRRFETHMNNVRENFTMKFKNLRIATIQSVLALGTMSFDSDENLLPSTSGAAFTIDFDVPATNQGDVDGIISAPWSTASTDIPTQIKKFINKIFQDTGFRLATALYGDKILSYLAQNDFVANQWGGTGGTNPNFSNEILKGNIPNGFMDIPNWQYFGSAYYEDQNGVQQNWIDDDAIIFIPEVTDAWWEIGQGDTPVPTSFEPSMGDLTGNGLDDFFTLEKGMYGYTQLDRESASVKWVHGDCMMPILKNGDVIIQADTTP